MGRPMHYYTELRTEATLGAVKYFGALYLLVLQTTDNRRRIWHFELIELVIIMIINWLQLISPLLPANSFTTHQGYTQYYTYSDQP